MPNPDTNLDGQVNVLDLILVASSFGEQPPNNPLADTNKDGVVNLLDLVFVAEHLSQNAAAPSQLDLHQIRIPSTAKEVIAAQRALTELEAIPNKSHGVQTCHRTATTLPSHRGTGTSKRPNSCPTTPTRSTPTRGYHTSYRKPIYSHCQNLRCDRAAIGAEPSKSDTSRSDTTSPANGLSTGMVETKIGEPVSSGVYFYTLNTDTYTQTRRMVIVK